MRSRLNAVKLIAFEALFMVLVVVAAMLVNPPTRAAADDFTDPAFTTETVATFSPYSLVGMAFAPDGRIFVWQKNGVIRIIKNGSVLPTPFLDISSKVNTFDDRGFWGLAFDPNFTTNRYIYMSYVFENTGNTNDTGAKTSRFTRVTADPNNPDVALPGSEVTILGSVGTAPCSAQPPGADCIPADGSSHTIGSIVFAPDGTLFLGNGDGSDASFADPLALRSQNLDSYNGKILHINKDGTAVPGNPFYDGTNSVRSKVWLYGVRNPFRFSIHPVTGDIWFGDVGWNTWEEVDRGVKGANYGWPCYEGTGVQPAYQNQAPCNTLPASAVTAPYHTYNHSVGSTAIGGPFYAATAYPQQYWGNFFFADYAGGFIKRVTFDANNNPTGVQPFATGVDSPVGLVLGPDGMIYYLAFNSGQIRRIRSNGPSAQASATPQYGYSPLSVTFSSAGSQNPGGGSLTYLWNFGDGATSTAANPVHTYTSGTVHTYTATLTVTNTSGRSSSATVDVTVGSVPPTPVITSPASGASVQPGQTITLTGQATDPEDGAISPANLKWTVLLHHNSHVHTFVGGTGSTGSFVVEDHGPIGTFSYEIILTATDSSGLSADTSVTLPVGSDPSPPTAPTNLTATASVSGISLGWTASTDNIGVANYRVERCQGAGCSTFSQVATPTGTTLGDSDVLPSTSYSYRAAAVDPSGNVSDYSNVASATTPAAPTGPPGLVAGYSFDAGAGATVADLSGNGNTATITGAATWTAGKYGGGLAFDGVASLVQVPSSPSLDLGSAMTLAAWIKPAATQGGWRTIMQRQTDAYFLNASNSSGYNVPAGGATTGGNINTVTGTTAAPVGAWTHVAMSYDGTSLRLYVNGTLVKTGGAGGAIQTSTNPLWIGGNSPYGEYFQGVIDEAQVYNRALSATEIQDMMAHPLAPPMPDDVAPTTPTGLTATAGAGGQINLAWNASTDNVAVTGYAVERCQGAGCTNFAQVGVSTGITFNDTGLAAATSYSYRVRATDAAANASGYSNTASASTTAAPDTTAPTAPSGLAATVAGTTEINLGWAASTDNVGVTGYRVERCQGASCTSWAEVGTSPTPSFLNTGLTAITTYRFRVRAADAAGNLSPYSNIVSATTQGGDTTRPSTPTGLTATPADPIRINLAWTASTDNVGVTGYRVERCQGSGCTNYAEIAQPTGTSYSDTGRSPSTLYRYRVRATDAAGNFSTYSSVVNATTPALPDTTPPSVPDGVTATAAGLGITLTWTASTDNVGVAGYRVERCQEAGCTTFAQVATPAAPGYTDSGLAPTTSYSYRVTAVDAAGNASGYSTVVSATTGATPVLPSGLVAGWSFNAGSGTTAVDSSGNGNTATLQNGATWAAGKYGSGVSFDGVDDLARVASSASITPTTGLTLAAWMKPSATQSGWRTIMQREVDSYFLNASNSAGNNLPAGGVTTGGGVSTVSHNVACPVNAWTHVAMTYDGAMLRLYVNGVQVKTTFVTGTIQASSNPLWIGGNSPYGEYFKGVIDEAQVYNRGLTAAEVQTVMSTPLS